LVKVGQLRWKAALQKKKREEEKGVQAEEGWRPNVGYSYCSLFLLS
jgi:hypothetical protein